MFFWVQKCSSSGFSTLQGKQGSVKHTTLSHWFLTRLTTPAPHTSDSADCTDSHHHLQSCHRSNTSFLLFFYIYHSLTGSAACNHVPGAKIPKQYAIIKYTSWISACWEVKNNAQKALNTQYRLSTENTMTKRYLQSRYQ